MFFSLPSGHFIRQYCIVIAANLSILCAGLGFGWSSPMLVKLRNDTNPVLSRPVTESEASWIASIGILFSIFMCIVATFLADWIGRKYTIAVAFIPKLASGFFFIFASEVWHLYVGRVLSSSGDSQFLCIVPIYASEIASKEIRGILGSFLQIFSSLGIVIMYSVGPFIDYVPLNIMYTCFIIVSFIPLLFLPDSPYFMYVNGKAAETEKVLLYLRDSEATVKEELKEYELLIESSKNSVSKRAIFKNKIFIKALILMSILMSFIQLVGFNAVTFYLQTVFESTQTSVSSEFSSVTVGLIQLIASFVTAFVIDRFGRRPILLLTLAGNITGMLGLAIFFQVTGTSRTVTGFFNYLPLISIVLYVFCFSAGLGSLSWTLLAELFDGTTRAVGTPTAIILTSVFAFITILYFPSLTGAIGAANTYFLFMGNCIIGFLFVWFFIPETKGKSFSEIQIALGGKPLREEKAV